MLNPITSFVFLGLSLRTVFAVSLALVAAVACSGEVEEQPNAGAGTLTPCLDTQNDPNNCGACGTRCASTDICQAGACVAVCGQAQAFCGGSCVSTASDAAHCGACGNSCGEGVCVNGQCAQSCTLTTCATAAGEECVDPLTNAAHCGACGNACSVDQVCVAGGCQLNCAPGLAACTDVCADLASDVANCGVCGTACGVGQVCTSGACGCVEGFSQCTDGCVDFMSDTANCGACGTACGDSFICSAGECACAEGTDVCGDGCADFSTDPANCGACGTACGDSFICSAGECACAEGTDVCGDGCADFSSDAANCGACGNQCDDSFVCQQGACACAEGQTDCDGQCVDLLAEDLNCGACGVECLGGSTCAQGVCECPEGQTLCGDSCVDLNESTDHCGACGNTCGIGDVCDAGACMGEDGCLSTPVTDLDVKEFAVYQSVKIPLVTAGGNQTLSVEEDATPLIVGREALFRVYVNPKADYRPRELSARLILRSEGEEESQFFFSKKAIAEESEEASGANSFQITVPPEAIRPNMEYALSVVSCEAAVPAPGEPAPPQVNTEDLTTVFPSEGFQALPTLVTGPIKIHMFPINDGNGGPNINDEMLDAWRARLLAIFPNPSVEFTMRDEQNTGRTGMCDQVGYLRSLRSREDPPTEVYYYGVTSSSSGRTAGCSGRSSNPRSTGARVSAGLDGLRAGPHTFVHELGHAAGRAHVDCGGPASPDPNYPYDDGDTGQWGFDIRTRSLKAPNSKDMMSYCGGSASWLSDYTYDALVGRQRAVYQLSQLNADTLDAVEPVAWRLLMSTSSQPHWVDEPLLVRGTPGGDLRSAVVLDASGAAIATVTVYAEELHDGSHDHHHMFTVPEPQAGWHTLQVPGLLPVQF